jgi:Carbohydrate family 9 binding domain-like
LARQARRETGRRGRDTRATGHRPPLPGRVQSVLLVNTDNAVTDEHGTGTVWDHSWTANATTAVTGTAGGYTVEIAVPWTALGGAPTSGATLGLDVANNDSDTAGQVTPYDWAHLTRFAQPQAWGTLTLG